MSAHGSVGRKSMDSISHGRGGAGNIGADSTPYVDGEITRTGSVGDHGDGAYGTGRGGAGNIGSPGLKPTTRTDAESIPEAALRPSQDIAHAGRGGAGNIAKEEGEHEEHHVVKPTHPTGLADKLKNKLFGGKKEKAVAK